MAVESQPLAFKRKTGPLVLPDNALDSSLAPTAALVDPRRVGETFEAVPDAWTEEGPESIPASKAIENDETRRLADLIQEQNEILIETQLQIQMFLSRRTLLAREVQNLEKKVAFLKLKLERLEKKDKWVDPQEISQGGV